MLKVSTLILPITLVCMLMSSALLTACDGSQAQTLAPNEVPTAPAVPEMSKTGTLHFLALGDMGSGLSAQKAIAGTMIQDYQQEPFNLVLMLGDNIYPVGDTKKYGQTRFVDPYKPLLNHGVRFMTALGNHDILLGHMKSSMAFFKMPAAYYDFVSGNTHFFVLDTNHFTPEQADWLSQRLHASKSPWKVVYGHHPIYSSGEHGCAAKLITRLKPILEAEHADFYLAGHDHDYERFAEQKGVTYIVSGGGGAELRAFEKTVPGSLVRLKVHEYLRFDIKGNTASFQAIDAQGKVLDEGQVMHASQEATLKAKRSAA